MPLPPFGFGFGGGARLCLFQRSPFSVYALLCEARGFSFCSGPRIGRAFEGFFRELFFAEGTYGIKFGLVALARQFECFLLLNRC